MEFIGHLRSSQRYSSLRQDWFLPTRVYLQKRKSKKKSPKRPANKPVLNYQYSHSVVSAPSAESLHKSVTDKKNLTETQGTLNSEFLHLSESVIRRWFFYFLGWVWLVTLTQLKMGVRLRRTDPTTMLRKKEFRLSFTTWSRRSSSPSKYSTLSW